MFKKFAKLRFLKVIWNKFFEIQIMMNEFVFRLFVLVNIPLGYIIFNIFGNEVHFVGITDDVVKI